MMPWAVARPARLAACARPRLRRMVIASSILPPLSARAALHSIMPAPVFSRSCLTWSAVIAVAVIAELRLRIPPRDPAHAPRLHRRFAPMPVVRSRESVAAFYAVHKKRRLRSRRDFTLASPTRWRALAHAAAGARLV